MPSGRVRVFSLWLSDACSIALAWCLIVIAYKFSGFGNYQVSSYLAVWPIVFVFTGINWMARLYHGRGAYPGMPLAPIEEFRRLVLSSLATHVLVMAFFGFQHREEDVSRFVLSVSGVLLMLIAQPMRNFVRLLLFKMKVGQIPAYVIGDGCVGERLRRILRKNPYYGFHIVRVFQNNELGALVKSARKNNVGHVFCCYKDERLFRVQQPVLANEFDFIEYLPTVRQFAISGSSAIAVGPLGGLEMVNQRRLKFLRVEKMVVDHTLAFVMLILSLPVFILVPILIKLTSRGPVFYRAERLGEKGRPIRVWKFRSMYDDADDRLKRIFDEDPAAAKEWAENFKLKNDPRVTPFGRFLRKTSIDELPQLINVITNEMALIGPRPIVQEEVHYYGKKYEIFSSVKPGVTGLWQTSGRSDCDYDERVALDIHYILNWSPWMDIWIVLRTFSSVALMRGAV